MEYIYFLILVILFVFGLFKTFITKCELYDFNVWWAISLLAVVLFISPVLSHISNLTRIKISDDNVKIHTEYRDNLIEKLNAIQSPSATLMNADTPHKSLISAIQEAEEGIGLEKLRRVSAERRILNTKFGPTAFVLWFYDERL